ncbi:unnamed protein product [Auanema sp. JU1783]|nr:unnamed protein product [Auanema sp. JU1783]
METEASCDDEHLSATVSTRRRSHSVSDDYSVQCTNDDATQCKYAAIQLKYWEDPFLERFLSAASDKKIRRDPEISIGYWARVAAVTKLVTDFIKSTDGKCQIISLGCGFDTLYWRLKKDELKFVRYVEVDFSSVTAKKIRHIMKPGSDVLRGFFTETPREEHHSDLHGGDYQLIGADLRQWSELKGKLDKTQLDHSIPTLVLAECVLVYMPLTQSETLIRNLAETFSTVVFVNYEQFRTSDKFGHVMEKNLEQRGIQLLGLDACASVDTQKERFLKNGWSNAVVLDMQTVYKTILSSQVRSIESIESLDEMELLWQLLSHYCIVHAVADKTSTFLKKLSLEL